MSQENVEIALRFMSLYNNHHLAAAAELCTDGVAVAPDRSVFPEGEPFTGRDAYVRFMQETWDAWVSSSVVVRDVVDAPGERVVMRMNWEAKGSASRLDLSTSLTVVVAFTSGEIASMAFFFNHADALKAVGLEE